MAKKVVKPVVNKVNSPTEAPKTVVVPDTAVLLKRVIRTEPLPCDLVEKGQFLHKIPGIDSMVLEAQIDELNMRLQEKIADKDVIQAAIGKAYTIGTVQLSLRDAEGKCVFASFDDARQFFTAKIPLAMQLWGLYSDNFDLTLTEKKS